jgi:two-component system phosphate regulon sensor histidine kinase PhoR
VFINLLDNAIKYGREGGEITISATENDRNEVQFSVRDNGIGIPKEDLPRIFERFYRVDKGRSHELGGTGLGLSIVKHIIQSHGGRVWADSKVGEGSTFYIALPRTTLDARQYPVKL